MGLLAPVVFVGSLALVALTGLVIIISSSRREPDPLTDHLRRRSMVFTVVGAIAAVVALVSLPTLPHGLNRALAPMTAGIAMTAVILVHELTWPRPSGPLRTASLRRRTLLGAAPRWLVVTTAVGVIAVWALDLSAIVVADPGGRTLTRVTGDTTNTHGPFPGTFYALPTLGASLLLLAVAGVTLWVIANRSGFSDNAQDAAFRRLSAHRALRGAAFGHLAVLAGHAVFVAAAIGSLYPSNPLTLVGVLLYVVAGVAFLGCLVVLFVASHALLGLPARTPDPASPSRR
jgi:hypothetical protein